MNDQDFQNNVIFKLRDKFNLDSNLVPLDNSQKSFYAKR